MWARLPEWLRGAIDAYDGEHGHQVPSLDVYWPTLGESPEHVLRSLQALIAANVPHPRDSLAEARRCREAAERDVMARLVDDETKRARFRATLDFYQGNAAVREDCNFYLQIGWPLMLFAAALVVEVGGGARTPSRRPQLVIIALPITLRSRMSSSASAVRSSGRRCEI